MVSVATKACRGCQEEIPASDEFCWSGCALDWEKVHPFDITFVVCPRCDGYGKHTNPAIDGHGITQDEMDELGPDFRKDYFGGVYDVNCWCCHGRNVVTPGMLMAWEEQEEARREYEAESRYAR